MKPTSIWTAILLGGLVAGTIDIFAASLINMLSPLFILQAIASGIYGKASFLMGAQSQIAGLLLQWGMSLIIAAVYVFAAQALPVLKQRWLALGLAYGVGIYIVMNYVVMPLSAVGHSPKFGALSFAENMLAMLLFGVIVAFFARGTAKS
ncbi:MAG TPA: hypothetical protein VHW02_10570 [Rhizomicrobium sp.]|jgi:uncharacterized membrane protein YagU involved in acid resistance|nr:hypothetical protein [Rhizomicrobium sp.]